MSRLKLEALESKFQYEMLEAKAVLEMYLVNGVGVAGHSEVIEEMEKQLVRFHEAKGKLESLRELVRYDEEPRLDTEEGEEE